MATGGIFQLITNDGRQDRLLMATDYLNKRLARIKAERLAAHAVDTEPTLADVTKTHILFTNAQFKPFAAIGYEYSKVNTNSGSAQYGSTVTFSIPQFGDLFHDMVVHTVLAQPTLAYDTSVLADRPAMRWCEYPGERFLRNTKFEVNGNPLDEYNNVAYNFYRQFQLPVNKIEGWKRLMGQETAANGFVDSPNWAQSGVTATTIRQGVTAYAGLQTPSPQKVDPVELFIPLLFWFNKDVRLSIPSVSIPYGQRFIYLTLATEREMYGLVPRGAGTWTVPLGTLTAPSNPIQKLELYINNLFVQPEIHKLYIKRVTFNLIRVHRQQDIVITDQYNSLLLQQLKWPTEALFVGAKMTDYVSQNAVLQAQNLDKWDSFSRILEVQDRTRGWTQFQEFSGTGTIACAGGTNVVTGAGGSLFLTEVKLGDFLVDSGGVAYGPVVAIASDTSLTVAYDIVPAFAAGPFTIRRPAEQSYTIKTGIGPLESINIKVHGIDIYKNFPGAFYNSYLPYHYGGLNINTPADVGAYMIPFCLFPGTYQPSGHINISRAREFYLEYVLKASIFAGLTSASAVLTILASAINFLLISDGSAVLRYTT